MLLEVSLLVLVPRDRCCPKSWFHAWHTVHFGSACSFGLVALISSLVIQESSEGEKGRGKTEGREMQWQKEAEPAHRACRGGRVKCLGL